MRGGSLPRGSPQWLDRAGSLGKPHGGSRIKTDPERGLTHRKSLPLGRAAAAPGSTTGASPAGTCPGPCLVGCEGWSVELGWELQLRGPWGGCREQCLSITLGAGGPLRGGRDGPACQELGLGPAPHSPRSTPGPPGAPGLGWLSCSRVPLSPRASRKQKAATLRPRSSRGLGPCGPGRRAGRGHKFLCCRRVRRSMHTSFSFLDETSI